MTAVLPLAFARAVGLVTRAPGFSHPSVPAPVRAGVALALAFAVAPGLHDLPDVTLPELALAVAGEFAVGAAIGFGAALLYDGAYFAGRTIDDYIGVRGSVPNANVTSAQGFGRLWSYAFLAAFFVLDGWVPVVEAFADSFAHVGAGAFVTSEDWLRFGLALPRTILAAAAMIAAPAIAVAAAFQFALAAVGRVVPRFAGFSLAFPIVFAAVLLVAVVTIPIVAPAGARPWLVLPWNGAP